VGLADDYKEVIATDPSAEQISNCVAHDKVTYRVEQAEHSSMADGAADLVTIANAIHWFSFDDFYKEVGRVLKPGGVIAAWCYRNPQVSPEVDEIVDRLHDDVLGDYWLAENRLVEKEYATIPFPFTMIESPTFISERRMDLDEFVGLLNTWSATQRFIGKNGYSPTDGIKKELSAMWKAHEKRTVRWRLILKVGRKALQA
jgi:SAM-dependent methyltransferase